MSTSALASAEGLQRPFIKNTLLALAGVRMLLAIIAIPLAPVLYEDHFLLLVLLRPTKEVFLAGGFLARQGDVGIGMIFLAAIPLSIFGVWLFYLLGHVYSKEIHSDNMPAFAARFLTPERIKKFERILDRKGPRLIFLGRLAVMSSATVGAAAGAAKLEPKKFFPWDGLGGLLSIAYTVAAGWFLGEAYEKAGPWISVAGVIALVAFAVILGRSLKEDS